MPDAQPFTFLGPVGFGILLIALQGPGSKSVNGLMYLVSQNSRCFNQNKVIHHADANDCTGGLMLQRSNAEVTRGYRSPWNRMLPKEQSFLCGVNFGNTFCSLS